MKLINYTNEPIVKQLRVTNINVRLLCTCVPCASSATMGEYLVPIDKFFHRDRSHNTQFSTRAGFYITPHVVRAPILECLRI